MDVSERKFLQDADDKYCMLITLYDNWLMASSPPIENILRARLGAKAIKNVTVENQPVYLNPPKADFLEMHFFFFSLQHSDDVHTKRCSFFQADQVAAPTHFTKSSGAHPAADWQIIARETIVSP